MIEDAIMFIVGGRPLTWQRARRGRHGPLFTPEDRENKMSEVRDAWRALGVEPFDVDVSLALGVAAICRRPANHFNAKGELKPWALLARPRGGQHGGDVSNFVKLVEDALNEVAYHDDAQIVEYLPGTGKWYVAPGEMPRTIVRLQVAEQVGVPVAPALFESSL